MNVSRRRYMGVKGGSIPYQRIEYLESTGTQWIDTGIKSAGNISIKISLFDYFNQDHLGVWAFCGKNGYLSREYGLFINGNTQKVNFRYDNTTIECYTYHSYPASCVVEIGNGTIKIGTAYSKNYTQKTFKGNYNVYLFAYHEAATVTGMNDKIGPTYISDGTITRDFIPVRIGQVGYMYDTVSGELFGNLGTGDFVLGPDIN